MSIGTGVVIASATLSATGTYSLTTSLLPAATNPYSLVAHYGGDGNFSGKTSPAIGLTGPELNSPVRGSFVTARGALAPATQKTTYRATYIFRIDATNPHGTPCQKQPPAA